MAGAGDYGLTFPANASTATQPAGSSDRARWVAIGLGALVLALAGVIATFESSESAGAKRERDPRDRRPAGLEPERVHRTDRASRALRAGLAGTRELPENILPTTFWVYVLVIAPLLCGLIGDFTSGAAR